MLLIYSLSAIIFIAKTKFSLVLFSLFCLSCEGWTLSCSDILNQAPWWGRLCCGACSTLSAACSRVCCHLFQSSLLSALLGELPLSQGKVRIHGRIAYVSQKPWVFSGTVRSNILFGKKYEKEHYEEVIKDCALEEVSSDFWIACTWISNDDSGLNYKVC